MTTHRWLGAIVAAAVSGGLAVSAHAFGEHDSKKDHNLSYYNMEEGHARTTLRFYSDYKDCPNKFFRHLRCSQKNGVVDLTPAVLHETLNAILETPKITFSAAGNCDDMIDELEPVVRQWEDRASKMAELWISDLANMMTGTNDIDSSRDLADLSAQMAKTQQQNTDIARKQDMLRNFARKIAEGQEQRKAAKKKKKGVYLTCY